MSRFYYTGLFEEPGSYGYVVAGIDHAYLNLVAMPEGEVVDPKDGFWHRFPVAGAASSLDEAQERLDLAFQYYSADQLFVLSKLDKPVGLEGMRIFDGRLDLPRVERSAPHADQPFHNIEGATVKILEAKVASKH